MNIRYHCCLSFFLKQKTAYEQRISDWSSDVCSSDLVGRAVCVQRLGIKAIGFQIPARRVSRGGRSQYRKTSCNHTGKNRPANPDLSHKTPRFPPLTAANAA